MKGGLVKRSLLAVVPIAVGCVLLAMFASLAMAAHHHHRPPSPPPSGLPTTTTVVCPVSVVYTGLPQTPCTATVTGSGGFSQSLKVRYRRDNTDAGVVFAKAHFGGNSTYAPSSGVDSFVITKAPSTTAVICPWTPTYTGFPRTPCVAKITGPGGLRLIRHPEYRNNINAGYLTATAKYRYRGDRNHTGSWDTTDFTILKADSKTFVACGLPPTFTVTYNGHPRTPCAAWVFGPGGLHKQLKVFYTNNVNAGTAWASASYRGDRNHNPSSDTEKFLILKADSTTTLICGPSPTYTGGQLKPCTASVAGAGGLNKVLPVNYQHNVNAGTNSATASAFYPGDNNHNKSSDTEKFSIKRASSTTVVTCPTEAPYLGVPVTPCSARVTGAGGLNKGLTVGYTGNNATGTASASASYVGDPNHTSSSDSTTFAIKLPQAAFAITNPGAVTTPNTVGVQLATTGGSTGNPVTYQLGTGGTSSCAVSSTGLLTDAVKDTNKTCVVIATMPGNTTYVAAVNQITITLS